MKIWLDDNRDPAEWLPHQRWWHKDPAATLDGWVWVRTAPDAIALLEAGGVTELSLDHDLGDERQVGSGYDVLLWIEERAATDDAYTPPLIHVHSSNIVAREHRRPRAHGERRSFDRAHRGKKEALMPELGARIGQ